MKLLLSSALALFVATASATDSCSSLEALIPVCAKDCVNNEAYKYCEPGDLACSCPEETLDKIIEGASGCVDTACQGAGPVFPPLRDWCRCEVDAISTPTTTSSSPEPTSSCDPLEAKIPDCAQDCVNNEAYKYCEPGDLECSCPKETLDKIIDGSRSCVEAACEGAGPVFPPLRDWCNCVIGDEPTTSSTVPPTTTTTTTTEPTTTEPTTTEPTTTEPTTTEPTTTEPTTTEPTTTEPTTEPETSTTTTSEDNSTTDTPTTSYTSGVETTTTLSVSSSVTTTGYSNSSRCSDDKPTTTSQAVTLTATFTTTSLHTITSCPPTVTNCPVGAVTTETVISTMTWCPEETVTLPGPSSNGGPTNGGPNPDSPGYTSQPAGTGGVIPVSPVPSATLPPPIVNAAASATHRNALILGGIVAAVVSLVWL